MRYCPTCQLLCDDEECPSCGSRQLRQPEENDPVLLLTTDELESGRITVALKDGKIPFEERVCGLEARPAAYFGPMAASRKNIYVPYSALEQAGELLGEIGIPRQEGSTDPGLTAMTSARRFVWRVISVLLFIVLVWGVVSVSDWVFGYLRGLMGY